MCLWVEGQLRVGWQQQQLPGAGQAGGQAQTAGWSVHEAPLCSGREAAETCQHLAVNGMVWQCAFCRRARSECSQAQWRDQCMLPGYTDMAENMPQTVGQALQNGHSKYKKHLLAML